MAVARFQLLASHSTMNDPELDEIDERLGDFVLDDRTSRRSMGFAAGG
jgi:hypothetical protein